MKLTDFIFLNPWWAFFSGAFMGIMCSLHINYRCRHNEPCNWLSLVAFGVCPVAMLVEILFPSDQGNLPSPYDLTCKLCMLGCTLAMWMHQIYSTCKKRSKLNNRHCNL